MSAVVRRSAIESPPIATAIFTSCQRNHRRYRSHELGTAGTETTSCSAPPLSSCLARPRVTATASWAPTAARRVPKLLEGYPPRDARGSGDADDYGFQATTAAVTAAVQVPKLLEVVSTRLGYPRELGSGHLHRLDRVTRTTPAVAAAWRAAAWRAAVRRAVAGWPAAVRRVAGWPAEVVLARHRALARRSSAPARPVGNAVRAGAAVGTSCACPGRIQALRGSPSQNCTGQKTPRYPALCMYMQIHNSRWETAR